MSLPPSTDSCPVGQLKLESRKGVAPFFAVLRTAAWAARPTRPLNAEFGVRSAGCGIGRVADGHLSAPSLVSFRLAFSGLALDLHSLTEQRGILEAFASCPA